MIAMPEQQMTEPYQPVCSHAETEIKHVGIGLTAEVCLGCGRVIR